MSTPSPPLAEENARLVERLAQLQECVWSGEERIQYLETTNAAMAEDLVQKSQLIDHYSMRGFLDTSFSEQVCWSVIRNAACKITYYCHGFDLNKPMNHRLWSYDYCAFFIHNFLYL